MSNPTDQTTPETNPHSVPLVADSLLLTSLSLAALIATAAAIALTGAMDLCTPPGRILLTVTWLVLPVAGIAPIFGVASTHGTPRRYLSATAAVVLTAMWLFGLVWAHVGEAINQVAC